MVFFVAGIPTDDGGFTRLLIDRHQHTGTATLVHDGVQFTRYGVAGNIINITQTILGLNALAGMGKIYWRLKSCLHWPRMDSKSNREKGDKKARKKIKMA